MQVLTRRVLTMQVLTRQELTMQVLTMQELTMQVLAKQLLTRLLFCGVDLDSLRAYTPPSTETSLQILGFGSVENPLIGCMIRTPFVVSPSISPSLYHFVAFSCKKPHTDSKYQSTNHFPYKNPRRHKYQSTNHQFSTPWI